MPRHITLKFHVVFAQGVGVVQEVQKEEIDVQIFRFVVADWTFVHFVARGLLGILHLKIRLQVKALNVITVFWPAWYLNPLPAERAYQRKLN